MSLPLQVIEGIFLRDADGYAVQSADGRVGLDRALSELEGHIIEAHLHHLPPTPPNLSRPGGGSCLWGEHCPHGHKERPAWLFRQEVSGPLTLDDDTWLVGGEPLRLDLMPGHQGRLVVLDEEALKDPEPDDLQSPDDLLREAEAMVHLLQGLQKAVKNDPDV